MNKKEFLLISIAAFITILAWLMIDLYQIKKSPSDLKNTQPIILSDYEINKKIILILKEDKKL